MKIRQMMQRLYLPLFVGLSVFGLIASAYPDCKAPKQGPPGLPGPAGAQGAQGDIGAQGPQGFQGTPGMATDFISISNTTSAGSGAQNTTLTPTSPMIWDTQGFGPQGSSITYDSGIST